MKNLDPYIGGRFIDEIHDGTFDKFRKDREAEGVSIGSVDRDVGTAARVLRRSRTEVARRWHESHVARRDAGDRVPAGVQQASPYPLDREEQKTQGLPTSPGSRPSTHTYGRRLRAAGVSLQDRQDLLGHELAG